MPPKKGGKHSDPAAGGAAAASAASAFADATFDSYVSPCFWKPAPPASTVNVFAQWQGQVPKDFPHDRDTVFFGGGGASRSFDAAVAGTAVETADAGGSSSEQGAAAAAAAAVAAAQEVVVQKIDIPDHRSDREKRLAVPASIVSRDSGSEDVAVNKLDFATLDTIPLDTFYKLLTETPFLKRETMLKKEQQRRRGDAEIFLDGQLVDVPSQYKTMLDRVFARLDQLGSKDQQLELPMVGVESRGRRTVWLNFTDICTTLGRTADEVKSFICNELTTTAKYVDTALHVDISRALTKEKLQKLVSDYAMSHVYCQSCHGFQTDLVRDTALRLDQVVCRVCGAKRSVEGTTGGFVAIANRRARLQSKRALA